jgi:hypothetical protein
MNRLLKESTRARLCLMRETGMDEMDYNLLILHTGCRFLERAVEPTEKVHEATAREYRYHIMRSGYWDWFEYVFRAMEVRTWKEWAHVNAVMLLQPEEYKRKHLLESCTGLTLYDATWASFDAWWTVAGRPMKLPPLTALDKQLNAIEASFQLEPA